MSVVILLPVSHSLGSNKTGDDAAEQGEDGSDNDWGDIPNELLFGPEGWCNAEEPVHTCAGFWDAACPPSAGTWPLAADAPSVHADCSTALPKTSGTKLGRPDASFAAAFCISFCRCDCLLDGLAGATCNITTEVVCPNQCAGHGECRLGFCKCHAGYYGADCSRLRAGAAITTGANLDRPAAESDGVQDSGL